MMHCWTLLRFPSSVFVYRCDWYGPSFFSVSFVVDVIIAMISLSFVVFFSLLLALCFVSIFCVFLFVLSLLLSFHFPSFIQRDKIGAGQWMACIVNMKKEFVKEVVISFLLFIYSCCLINCYYLLNFWLLFTHTRNHAMSKTTKCANTWYSVKFIIMQMISVNVIKRWR